MYLILHKIEDHPSPNYNPFIIKPYTWPWIEVSISMASEHGLQFYIQSWNFLLSHRNLRLKNLELRFIFKKLVQKCDLEVLVWYSRFFLVGMCRWKTKTDPCIYQILTQNWTHIFTKNQKFAPILRIVCKIYVKFANILEIFSKISRK